MSRSDEPGGSDDRRTNDPAALPPMPPRPDAPTPPAAAALFRGVPPRAMTLGTAIEAAFRALAKPAFVVPILVIAIVINAITEIVLGPTLDQLQELGAGARITLDDLDQLVGALGVSLVISVIGGAVAAIYGSIWAVAASVGPFPGVGQTLELVGRRGARVLGASILVGAITLGALLLAGLSVAVLSQASPALGFGLAVALLVALVWLVARLYMTTWLAADGSGVMESLRGSWRITEGGVLRIIGWSFAYGLLFALVSAAAGVVLGRIPYLGQGVATGLTLALSYGAGVTLFRRTQAGAPPAPTAATSRDEPPVG